jgi:hypothetical protein
VQDKGTEHLFNKIKAQSFPNIETKTIILKQEVFRTLNRRKQKKKKKTSHYHIVIKTLHIQNTNEYLNLQERSTKYYIMENPSE